MGKCVCGTKYPDDYTVYNIQGKDGVFRTVLSSHPICMEKARKMNMSKELIT